MTDAERDATACIYQPHHPDALRDGLLRGFRLHRRGADEKSARSLAGERARHTTKKEDDNV